MAYGYNNEDNMYTYDPLERQRLDLRNKQESEATRLRNQNFFNNYKGNNSRMATEELLEQLQNQIYKDQYNLSKQPYSPYKGETFSPMSMSTQNARKFKEEWAKKPAPYSNKMETVLKRENQGFTPEQTQDLLNRIRRGTTSEDMVLERLGKQFDRNYGYENERGENLKGKINKDIDRNLNLSKSNIGNLSEEIKQLEGKRGTNIVNALHGAGLGKEHRRKSLTNQLEEFGNQEHAFANLRNKANRDTFEEEQMAPYYKINQARAGMGGIDTEEMHPDKAQIQNEQMQRVLNAYNRPYQKYPGERVVGTEPETQTGWNLTNRINPKYQDKFYNERKQLEGQFLGDQNIGTQTFNKLPETLEPLMANLDYLTKKQLKHEANVISGKHRTRGTYGSGAHKGETEKALREMIERVQKQREGALLGSVKTQAGLAGMNERNNIDKYNQMTGLGVKEFGDVLGGHKNLVNLGNAKWRNKQEEENERLRNWSAQINHETPALQKAWYNQGVLGGNAIGQNQKFAPFQQLASQYNTNLENLFGSIAPYNENKKTFNAFENNAQKDIYNQQQNQQQSQIEWNKQLEEAKKRNSELERVRSEAIKNYKPVNFNVPPQQLSQQERMNAMQGESWKNLKRDQDLIRRMGTNQGFLNPNDMYAKMNNQLSGPPLDEYNDFQRQWQNAHYRLGKVGLDSNSVLNVTPEQMQQKGFMYLPGAMGFGGQKW